MGVLKLPICYFIPLNHKTHALSGLLLLKKFILYLLELLWLGSEHKIIYFILSLSSLSPSLSPLSAFPPSLSDFIFSLLQLWVSMVEVVDQFWVVMIIDLLCVTMDRQLGCGLMGCNLCSSGFWVGGLWFGLIWVQVEMIEFQCWWFLSLLAVVGEWQYGIWLVNDGMVVEISCFLFIYLFLWLRSVVMKTLQIINPIATF